MSVLSPSSRPLRWANPACGVHTRKPASMQDRHNDGMPLLRPLPLRRRVRCRRTWRSTSGGQDPLDRTSAGSGRVIGIRRTARASNGSRRRGRTVGLDTDMHACSAKI
eukprot:6497601-Pyramimonas_sp.AAC.2